MAYTTIDDPSAYFHTQLYTGNATARSITNDANAGDFQPDWLWIKVRNNANNHRLFDSSRGANLDLVSNLSQADSDSADRCTDFDSNGFSLGVNAEVNSNTHNIVAWQWKANGGTTASNTDGSITSTVQVDDDAGFSIVLYTGNETDNATIGHGLSAAPDVVIVKNRDTARTWLVGHSAYVNGGSSENMRLNSTMAVASADNKAGSGWSRTAFGDSVFTVGNGVDGDYTSSTNNGSDAHVAYCFRSIQGYSKFGSYTGNGNVDGTFVYTGFKPAWVMCKSTASTSDWYIYDNKREGYNVDNDHLLANSTAVESTANEIDMLSNGFKLRIATDPNVAEAYIYMAFAEHPFVSSEGVPTTAVWNFYFLYCLYLV